MRIDHIVLKRITFFVVAVLLGALVYKQLEHRNLAGSILTMIDGHPITHSVLPHGSGAFVPAHTYALLTCPSDDPPIGIRWSVPNDLTLAGADNPLIYEYSSDFLTEKDSSLPLLSRWAGRIFSHRGISTLSTFSKGRTYFVTASNDITVHCSVPAGLGGTHPVHVKFYISQDLIANRTLEEVSNSFVHYVEDLNRIFERNTSVRFSYDPATDVQFWNEEFPPSGPCYEKPKPELHVYIYFSGTKGTLNRGGGGCNLDQLRVYGLLWSNVWNEQELEENPVGFTQSDYALQIQIVAHEMGHAFGLAIGEYYSIGQAKDHTESDPILNIQHPSGPDGPQVYWKERHLVINDPLLVGFARNRSELNQVKFSPLSATIINKYFAGEFADCQSAVLPHCSPPAAQSSANETVRVLVSVIDDESQNAIEGCAVRVYYVNHTGVYLEVFSHQLIANGQTNAKGEFEFIWGRGLGQNIHSASNIARLVKVSCDNYEPSGEWISTFDLQAGLIMPEGGADGDFHYPGKLIIKNRRL